jgi:DNA-binding MurR/RpiR family transcriptional regulator
MRETSGLTPTQAQLAHSILNFGGQVQNCSIKELARATSTSVASIHRLCKKLGLEGYKELKVEIARSSALRMHKKFVNINFPFDANSGVTEITSRIGELYEMTLRETCSLLDPEALERAANLISSSSNVDIYTRSHNLYPARLFVDRMLSIGRAATCHDDFERQAWSAMSSDSNHVAIAISYSGLADILDELLPILASRSVPVIFIGTPDAAKCRPGLDIYLYLGDSEDIQNRIVQFASHIAVQFVLDSLYSCVFARNYKQSLSSLQQAQPYTTLLSPDERPCGYRPKR